MSMDCGIEQSNCTDRASPAASSGSAWGAPAPGWPSGCGGIGRRGGPGCVLAAEPLSGNGNEPPTASSRALWRFERLWSSDGLDDRGLRAAAPKWSTSSCNTNGCGRCRRSARSSASSGGTAIPSGGRAGARAANPTRRRELGSQAICSKPIWWGRAISAAPEGSPASIRCTPWRSSAGAWRPPRGATRRPSCCASICPRVARAGAAPILADG